MPEITKTGDKSDGCVPRWVWAAFAVLITGFYFYGLDMPLVGPDESRYAQVAREMFERADFITPTLAGYPWLEKPALVYWLQIASFSVFGVSEFSARLGAALCGLGTIGAMWLLGHFAAKDVDFAGFLTVMAASAFGLVVFARGATFDVVVTFAMTAALVGFYRFDRSGKASALAAFYFFIGVALLAKGLIGIVLPAVIVASYYLLTRRRPPRLFLTSLAWGLPLAVAVASIWYIPVYLRHGMAFIDEFFIQHHFARFTSNRYQHPQPFHFFFWVLPLMTLPWMPLFLASVASALRRLVKRDASDENSLIPFAVAWLSIPLLFFSVSGSKLPGYILPALPPSMILTAVFSSRLAKKNRLWRIGLLSFAVMTFIGLSVLLVRYAPEYMERESVKQLIEAANAKGFRENPVLVFDTISHNAEFYAAGRMVRDEFGRQKRLSSYRELIDAVAAENTTTVVLMPKGYASEVIAVKGIKTEVLKDNGELAVALVSIP